jgi:hypothetical protein
VNGEPVWSLLRPDSLGIGVVGAAQHAMTGLHCVTHSRLVLDFRGFD